ncbi:MAG: Crp/Fnr family transcriptional regulator [Flavobacteriales bacterium]|nr:Crp/Fnr family transcriptional regulator [Flavobacteriales bacterium]
MEDITSIQENTFRKFVDGTYVLDEVTWGAFVKDWSYFEAKRKNILTTAGEVEKYVYFVLEGVQRAYYVGENDKEATIVFTYAPSFSGVADSALTGLPSKYYFETITSSQFLRIRIETLNKLMEEHRPIQNLIMRLASLSLYGVLARQAEIQSFSSEEKFRTLLHRSPHLLQLVPHKYIASYLGIDATNFSKLLGSVKL